MEHMERPQLNGTAAPRMFQIDLDDSAAIELIGQSVPAPTRHSRT